MKPNFSKYTDALIPVIVQDNLTNKVLMQAYMNEDALAQTIATNKVTFFSRSKNRLWVKGESSGNYLTFVSMQLDCDNDAILIKAIPQGPVCHTGADTCFNEQNPVFTLNKLEAVIAERKENPKENSYTASLFAAGINKIAQKVGEEAVELVIESKDDDENKFLNEAADLLFHYLILLQAKNKCLENVIEILAARHQ